MQFEIEILLKIALAAVLGGAMGAERERSGKWAGLRTHMLVAVGAALLTDVSVSLGARYHGGSNAWDPARLAAQIVTGVGFLGAGTILQARGSVRGLTTAAGLWVAAAIGIAVGGAYYFEAAATAVVVLLVLAGLRPLERRLFSGKEKELVFSVEGRARLSEVLERLDRSEPGYSLAGAHQNGPRVDVTLRVENEESGSGIVALLAEMDGVELSRADP